MKLSIFNQGSKRISLEKLFSNKIMKKKKKNKKKLILDHISKIDNEPFTPNDVKKVFNGYIELDMIHTYLSRLCVNGVLIRLSKGLYIKGNISVESITSKQLIETPNNRWEDKNGPNKIFITDLQYKKVSRYFNGNSMILCGPNVDLRIRQAECITNGNHDLYLVDNNSDIFDLIKTKIKNSGNKNVKPIFKNIYDINIHPQFQDLDFCNTLVYKNKKDNKYLETGEILAYRLIKQKEQGYPIAAMNFTFCGRRFKRKIIVRQINSILHILNSAITGFDYNVKGCSKGVKIIPDSNQSFGYYHIPNWINKGKILEFDFYTYSDTQNQMITCLIIYKL